MTSGQRRGLCLSWHWGHINEEGRRLKIGFSGTETYGQVAYLNSGAWSGLRSSRGL